MIILYLCRHGRTIENEKAILQGQSSEYGHLSETGKAQAAIMGDKLREIKADAIITSDLQRCIDTAHIALGNDVKLIKEPLLRERDWTTMVGRPIAEGMLEEEKYAESVESMSKRVADLLKKWQKEYEGKTIIAIGHGFIDRVLQAVYFGKNYLDIKPMENSEVRKLELDFSTD